MHYFNFINNIGEESTRFMIDFIVTLIYSCNQPIFILLKLLWILRQSVNSGLQYLLHKAIYMFYLPSSPPGTGPQITQTYLLTDLTVLAKIVRLISVVNC